MCIFYVLRSKSYTQVSVIWWELYSEGHTYQGAVGPIIQFQVTREQTVRGKNKSKKCSNCRADQQCFVCNLPSVGKRYLRMHLQQGSKLDQTDLPRNEKAEHAPKNFTFKITFPRTVKQKMQFVPFQHSSCHHLCRLIILWPQHRVNLGWSMKYFIYCSLYAPAIFPSCQPKVISWSVPVCLMSGPAQCWLDMCTKHSDSS